MKKLPRSLRIGIVVVAVLLIVALVVPYFLDLDHYRTVIASAIEQETGRKVTIGKIHARLLPSVGFVIDDFRLGNPPGFPEGNLLTVDAVRGSLAWGPLLRREFQLRSVSLVHPQLHLLEKERGQTNYSFETRKKPAPPKGAAAAAGFHLADIDSIGLQNVELVMGQVSGRRTVVRWLRAAKLDAYLSDVTLDAARLKQWQARSNLAGASLELAGLKGPVQFQSGDFRLREGKVDAKFDAEIASAARVKGTLKVADIEHALATFDLNTPLLDVDQLAAAGVETPAAPPFQGKSELVAQGRLAVTRVRFAAYEATGATAEVRVFTDRVEAWPVTLALYGGSLQVSARVDRRQSPQRFSANVKVRDVDIGKMLAAAAATRGKMTGTADLNLQAFGSQGRDMLNSLTGTGDFAVRNGKFPGFSMGSTLQSLAKIQRLLTFGAGSGGFTADTTFSLISGDLSLGSGRVSSSRIHLDSPSGTVDLRGSFGFDQTLDYNGQAVLMGNTSGSAAENPVQAITGVLGGVMKQTVGRISIPFAVRGTFSQPKIMPGAGIPSIQTTSPSQTTNSSSQQPQKKKSIFDIFRKP